MRFFTTVAALASCLSLTIGAATPLKRSAGCGVQHDFVGSTRSFTIQSNGRSRRFLVHLPSNYNEAADTGVVVAYHGADGNPEGYEPLSRFSNTTVNPNLIAVYPAGVSGYWQGPSYATAGVRDDIFTSDMIDYLQANFCIDPARIYAAGYSNGGGFVGLLACSKDHGGQFAAFAGVAAALYADVSGNDNCSPQRSPMPWLEFHSRDDPTVPYAGGEGRGGPLPSITEWLGRWVRRNGCRTPVVTELATGAKRHNWGCGSKEGNQRHYELRTEGHSWPRREVDASQLIVDWLLTQKKPIYT